MLIQATLVAIVAFLASVDEQLFGASMMGRPLFTGMLVGAIMGVWPPVLQWALPLKQCSWDRLWSAVRCRLRFTHRAH